jgi:hypothetical protein
MLIKNIKENLAYRKGKKIFKKNINCLELTDFFSICTMQQNDLLGYIKN